MYVYNVIVHFKIAFLREEGGPLAVEGACATLALNMLIFTRFPSDSHTLSRRVPLVQTLCVILHNHCENWP